jgi:hypothetical protein
MKHLIIPVLLLLLIFINSCDNSIEPAKNKTSGEITINTKLVNQGYSGFSFSEGGIINAPNPRNIIPDIIVLVQTNENGHVLGVFLAPPGISRPTFRLLNQFNDADSAKIFFNKLSEVPDSSYRDLALPAKGKQIWAVKTGDDKYGIILILDTKAYAENSNPGPATLYGEARFKWKYQPSGSRFF